ncbi:hypothetical protein BOO86_11260 [Mycobacterium sp. CBMA 234]|uniref:hypothetical protein n=1 Tax=Mycolicibacterium sp. CBMA 234 TaxID=1918495 RepID=UPI0012DD944B|nr:hypothetical protein [Mycolicibacterium sp. CBMA 234]MUL65043.1 hypothetical protein [Mycolicibacterium sp. CBMA 234]
MGRHRAPNDDESRDDETSHFDALSPDIPEADDAAADAPGFRVPDDWAEMHGMPPAATPPAATPSAATPPPPPAGDRYATDEPDEPDYPADDDGSESITQAFPSVPRRASVRAHGGDWEGGEWTGSHRAIQTKRRGVSVGVIAALVTVVVVVAAVILWRFFGSVLSDRSREASARCVSGSVSVPVMVDASISDQLNSLAGKYNQTAAPIGDKCIKIDVKATDPNTVVDGVVNKWPANLGPRPVLWIPASSVSEARLVAGAGEQAVTGDTKSLVTSPVVLAVRPQLKDALAQQNWGTLPTLQTTPTALDGLNLAGWGSLRLALPTADNGDATYLAAEAVAFAAAGGAPANAGAGAVHRLMGAQPKLADAKASTAFDALTSASDPATAPVHAVVTTEQQLYQRSQHTDDAKSKLAAWLPAGAPAVADYPIVQLAGDGLSHEAVAAASEFERFLLKPDQLAELSNAGFRVSGSAPPKNDVVNLGSLPDALAIGDSGTRATLANAVGGTSKSAAVTILLDQSMPAADGSKTRLGNVTNALMDRLKTMSPNSSVGLWTFDGVSGRTEIPLAPLGDTSGSQTHAAQLTSNLNNQSSSGGGHVSFTTLRMLYPDAVSKYVDGQANSILVITAGPHTDQSLDGQGLQDYIKSAFDQSRPVAVSVIDIGSDSDSSTWQAVSQLTGGTYTNLQSTAGPDLTAAVAAALP